MHFPRKRRFAIALVALLLSALCFRGSLAVALVTRGDGLLQRGRPDLARTYYARALFADPGDLTAADRYAFAGFELRTPEAIASSLRIASKTLAQHPDDIPLLEDRALLEEIGKQHRAAHADFQRIAALTHDPRWRHFAAWEAYRADLPHAQAPAAWNGTR